MKACDVHRAAPVAVTTRVDRVSPCELRTLAAVQEAAERVAAEHAARQAGRAAVDDTAPMDAPAPDEETVSDPTGPDEEPTTVRPTPIPAELIRLDAAFAADTTPDAPAPSRGRVGKYQLSTRLARGAFGVVYTARDPSLERNVAIKVLRPNHLANQEIVQRFLQEARATARVAHPGIVTIHDCGMVETRRGPTAFIAMELLSGASLSRRLAHRGPFTPAAACEIARQVASALEAAHHVDVLHRDLKPDNIFLVPDPAMPSGERVKVLDFGLAKLGASGLTQLQMVFGTPRYMSPEQGRSATQIDRRSDIYSLGCILFELVTGRTPFDGDPRQLLERHQHATPPRASSLAPDVSPVLDELIADMLAKDPMDRPQTMGAVQRILRFAADDLAPDARPEARPPDGPGPPQRPGPAIRPGSCRSGPARRRRPCPPTRRGRSGRRRRRRWRPRCPESPRRGPTRWRASRSRCRAWPHPRASSSTDRRSETAGSRESSWSRRPDTSWRPRRRSGPSRRTPATSCCSTCAWSPSR